MFLKLSLRGVVVCGIGAVALMISLAPAGMAADNLDQMLGLTPPTPRDNNKSLSFRSAPTPTQDQTARPSRGDLHTHQSSHNNQMDFAPLPKP